MAFWWCCYFIVRYTCQMSTMTVECVMADCVCVWFQHEVSRKLFYTYRSPFERIVLIFFETGRSSNEENVLITRILFIDITSLFFNFFPSLKLQNNNFPKESMVPSMILVDVTEISSTSKNLWIVHQKKENKIIIIIIEIMMIYFFGHSQSIKFFS